MITIKSKSREFTKVEEYLMTIAPSIVSMKDVPDDTIIAVNGVLIFEDNKDDDPENISEILSIITPDNIVYSCQSATFKRSLNDILNMMDGANFSIKKISGKTKNGRDYINCVLDINSVQS